MEKELKQLMEFSEVKIFRIIRSVAWSYSLATAPKRNQDSNQ